MLQAGQASLLHGTSNSFSSQANSLPYSLVARSRSNTTLLWLELQLVHALSLLVANIERHGSSFIDFDVSKVEKALIGKLSRRKQDVRMKGIVRSTFGWRQTQRMKGRRSNFVHQRLTVLEGIITNAEWKMNVAGQKDDIVDVMVFDALKDFLQFNFRTGDLIPFSVAPSIVSRLFGPRPSCGIGQWNGRGNKLPSSRGLLESLQQPFLLGLAQDMFHYGGGRWIVSIGLVHIPVAAGIQNKHFHVWAPCHIAVDASWFLFGAHQWPVFMKDGFSTLVQFGLALVLQSISTKVVKDLCRCCCFNEHV